MSGGARSPEARRAELVARAAAERESIAREFAPLGKPLAVADQGVELIGRVKPFAPAIAVVVGLGLAALILARSRTPGSVLKAGATALKAGQSVQRLLSRF